MMGSDFSFLRGGIRVVVVFMLLISKLGVNICWLSRLCFTNVLQTDGFSVISTMVRQKKGRLDMGKKSRFHA